MSVSLQNGLEYSVASVERQDAEPNEDRVSLGLCTSRIDHLQQRVLLMDRFLFVVCRSVDIGLLYYVNAVD